MRKLFSLILALVFALSLSVSTYAVSAQSRTPLSDFSVEVSIDDLKDGITIVVEKDENGEYILRQLSNAQTVALESNPSPRVVSTFHCGITYHSATSTAHIHWTAAGERLTRVHADVFCQSTSMFFPDTYFEGTIDGYADLGGRYNTANGVTDDFDIPNNVDKVKVGWSSATVSTVTSTVKIPGASQTVSLN